jgi:hypothetical protein
MLTPHVWVLKHLLRDAIWSIIVTHYKQDYFGFWTCVICIHGLKPTFVTEKKPAPNRNIFKSIHNNNKYCQIIFIYYQ